MSREESWSQLARHLRWCSDCHFESSGNVSKCPTMRRLWLETIGYIPWTWHRSYMDRPDNFCCPCSAHAYERQRRNLRRHCAVLTGPVTRAWQMYAAVFNARWP